MEDFILKKALLIDRDNIYNLKKENLYTYIHKIWGWDENYQRQEFNEDYKNLEEFYSILNNENDFLGYLQINETKDFINICELHIKKEYQNKSIGTRVISNIISGAIKKNKYVRLGCFKDNVKAIRLYKKLGFIIEGYSDTHIMFIFKG